MRLLIINGPNLNLLGTREPDIYGSETLGDLEAAWRRHGTKMGIGIDAFQSNHEGGIIDEIHASGPRHNGIVINAGALTHYSYAIHDALVAIEVPVVEVHISNVHEREEWRRSSVIAPATERVIYGRGTEGYLDAINLLVARNEYPPTSLHYGPDPDQVIDLRIPARPKALVVLIHGGFWRSQWARDTLDPLAAALAEVGYATANIEYRRGPGSVAVSRDDVERAIEAISSHLTDTVDIDLPTVVVGHSAGGYLAIRYGESHPDVTTVALSPAIDLEALSAERPGDDPIAAYIGADRATQPGLWEEAALSGRNGSNLSIVHGLEDASIPSAHSEAFHASHPATTLVTLEGVDHSDLIRPHHDAFDAITAAIDGGSIGTH